MPMGEGGGDQRDPSEVHKPDPGVRQSNSEAGQGGPQVGQGDPKQIECVGLDISGACPAGSEEQLPESAQSVRSLSYHRVRGKAHWTRCGSAFALPKSGIHSFLNDDQRSCGRSCQG